MGARGQPGELARASSQPRLCPARSLSASPLPACSPVAPPAGSGPWSLLSAAHLVVPAGLTLGPPCLTPFRLTPCPCRPCSSRFPGPLPPPLQARGRHTPPLTSLCCPTVRVWKDWLVPVNPENCLATGALRGEGVCELDLGGAGPLLPPAPGQASDRLNPSEELGQGTDLRCARPGQEASSRLP